MKSYRPLIPVAFGLAAVGAVVFWSLRASRRVASPLADGPSMDLDEARIDASLADSFPASDPPSWTLGAT
jgi:hypothetical protein